MYISPVGKEAFFSSDGGGVFSFFRGKGGWTSCH